MLAELSVPHPRSDRRAFATACPGMRARPHTSAKGAHAGEQRVRSRGGKQGADVSGERRTSQQSRLRRCPYILRLGARVSWHSPSDWSAAWLVSCRQPSLSSSWARTTRRCRHNTHRHRTLPCVSWPYGGAVQAGLLDGWEWAAGDVNHVRVGRVSAFLPAPVCGT